VSGALATVHENPGEIVSPTLCRKNAIEYAKILTIARNIPIRITVL
jgi:hypothetical protein